MTAEAITAIVAALSAFAGIIGGLTVGWYTWRKDGREKKAQDDTEADRTIGLLEKQNDLLLSQNATLQRSLDEIKRQGEVREGEWQKREADWKREKVALEARVEGVERDYRALVSTVTSMGFCANAAKCDNYNPGDRRSHVAGGTGDTV